MERNSYELEYLLNSLVANSVKADRIRHAEDYSESKLKQSTYNKLMYKVECIKKRIIKIYTTYTI